MVIYASFDPPLEIVSLGEIFKIYSLNGPSDKNFFLDTYKNANIKPLVDVYSF